jgi:hypothetical protein
VTIKYRNWTKKEQNILDSPFEQLSPKDHMIHPNDLDYLLEYQQELDIPPFPDGRYALVIDAYSSLPTGLVLEPGDNPAPELPYRYLGKLLKAYHVFGPL